MSKYASYKDSGVEWIGRIPSDWDVVKMKTISNVKNGFPFDSDKFDNENGFPLIRIRDIKSQQIQTFFNGEYPKGAIVNNDDLLIGMDGDFNVCWWTNGSALLNQRLMSLEGIEMKSNKKFIFYAIQRMLKVVNEQTYSTTVKHLSSIDFLNYHISLPKLSEQINIANYLDNKTSQIEDLILKKQQLIELLKEKRQIAITEGVTKGLNREAEMRDSGIEWIGKIPKHWGLKKIKHISPVKRGASPRPIDDPKFFDENGEYHWVRIADVTSSGKFLESTIQKMSEIGSRLSVKKEPGELFLSIAGTVRKPCITKIKCCIHDGFVYFPTLDSDFSEYIYYIFETGQPYKGLGKLGTQLNLNSETVGDIIVPVPPKSELIKINEHLIVKSEKFDVLIKKINEEIHLLEEYKQALIYEAVTGKIKIDNVEA